MSSRYTPITRDWHDWLALSAYICPCRHTTASDLIPEKSREQRAHIMLQLMAYRTWLEGSIHTHSIDSTHDLELRRGDADIIASRQEQQRKRTSSGP